MTLGRLRLRGPRRAGVPAGVINGPHPRSCKRQCPLLNAAPFGLAAALLVSGCGSPDRPVNRSFPLPVARAVGVLQYDAKHAHRLRRPLVIIGGFLDPGWAAPQLRDRFRKWTGDPRVTAVSLGFDTSFDECRRDVVAAVDAAYPTADPDRTAEVDVIGVSMGGLVARYAALPAGPGERSLRIARLFTISSPLRGASEADAIPLNLHPLQGGLRSGSWLYRRLADTAPADPYAVYSYVRLGDGTVGAANAAVPGVTPWWVATPPLTLPHDGAYADPRILADIACRLRGEPPLTHDPPAPLP